MVDRSNIRRWALVSLTALTAMAVGMLVLRRKLAPNADDYRFLLWNLFLAWIPMACALGAYELVRRERGRLLTVIFGVVWLAFLPNAPYLMTDFIHLETQPGLPLWFDTLLFGVFGLSGLLLGVASLWLMHSLIRRVVPEVVAWLSISVVVALTSFGILLGRILRWNSWDLVTKPGHLWADLERRSLNPMDHPRIVGWTIAFVLVIGVTYVLVDRVLAGGRQRLSPS